MLHGVMREAGRDGFSVKLTTKCYCKLAKNSYGATTHRVTEHD